MSSKLDRVHTCSHYTSAHIPNLIMTRWTPFHGSELAFTRRLPKLPLLLRQPRSDGTQHSPLHTAPSKGTLPSRRQYLCQRPSGCWVSATPVQESLADHRPLLAIALSKLPLFFSSSCFSPRNLNFSCLRRLQLHLRTKRVFRVAVRCGQPLLVMRLGDCVAIVPTCIRPRERSPVLARGVRDLLLD